MREGLYAEEGRGKTKAFSTGSRNWGGISERYWTGIEGNSRWNMTSRIEKKWRIRNQRAVIGVNKRIPRRICWKRKEVGLMVAWLGAFKEERNLGLERSFSKKESLKMVSQTSTKSLA